MMHKTLIADPSPVMRRWYRAMVGGGTGATTEVAQGWEILWQLAEGRFDLVVASGSLPDLAGTNVLAMVRGAGVDVPFLLVFPCCPDVARGIVRRAGNAALVEDWSNGRVIRNAVRQLRGEVMPAVRPALGSAVASVRP